MAVDPGNGLEVGRGSGQTISATFTVQDADDAIAVMTSVDGAGATGWSGVTIDPGGADEAAFTEVATAFEEDTGAGVFLLLDTDVPAAGDYIIEVTVDVSPNQQNAYIRALQGAKQETPSGSNIATATGGVSSFDTDVEGFADGQVLDATANRSGEAPTNDGDNDILETAGADAHGWGFSRAEPTADGTVTMGWSWGSSAGEEAHATMAIAPASTGGGSLPLLTPPAIGA